LRATPEFVFLRALPRLSFQKASFFFAANLRLFGFDKANLFKLSLARGLSLGELRFDFGAARVFHRSHAIQFFLNAGQLTFGNAAPGFFIGVLACFSFDTQLLLFGAPPRGFFLILAPSLRLLRESPLGLEPGGLEFSPARVFFGPQAK
jgi:hypothetical protein